MISREEALIAIEGALSRIALLHVSFSKTIIDELGEEKGKNLIIKSIIEYGHRMVGRVKKALPGLTELGLYEEVGMTKEGVDYSKGCALAKVFREQDAMDVGYLYCYVDPAKAMAWDLDAKIVHLTSQACGDEDCKVEILQTTDEEKKDFTQRARAWRKVDPRLYEYSKNH